MKNVAAAIEETRGRIRRACERAGRDPASVRLIGVTKTHGPEAVQAAIDAGLPDVGESYAQELRDKQAALQELSGVRWHYIGAVQRNKIRYLVGKVSLVHAVDRADVAEALSERAERGGEGPVPVLLSVNVGGEESKSGVDPEELSALFREVSALPGVTVRGLMCLPPWSEDPEAARPHFRRLRELRDALVAEGAEGLDELSMGMSHDLEVAVEEGATLVRVGTAIFGERERRT